jgi:glycerol kinase
MEYVLALDQGTTSSRVILYNRDAEPIASEQQEFNQIFPEPGWVEHDANEIWESQANVVQKLIGTHGLNIKDIKAIGITNQRETTVLWDRKTGQPIHNAIVWQDRRTAAYCNSLKAAGHEALIANKTGLVIDAYFSGTKIKWLLDNVPGARERAEKGELAFGTIDSWLVWNLTNGQLHITDVSNASRTLLFNIHTLEWDAELMALLDIPASLLPEVRSSSEVYGTTTNENIGVGIPIAGIAGDQQAALFGQMCLEKGMAKCTYGTGSFLISNTGPEAIASKHRLLSTIGWQLGANGVVQYALEGSVFMGGAVIQWLRDGMELFQSAAKSEDLASTVEDNGGVVFVPALTGLGAPHWDPTARGAIFGITRGTTKAHLTRAALESIAYQVDDILSTMAQDTGEEISELKVDGGATANNLLVQFQADISNIKVVRPANLETTALGAAYLAGLGVGLWQLDELKKKWEVDKVFEPGMEESKIQTLKSQWHKAIERSKNWID